MKSLTKKWVIAPITAAVTIANIAAIAMVLLYPAIAAGAGETGAPPQGFVAENHNSGARLSWLPPNGSTPDSYRVMRKGANDEKSVIMDTVVGQTSYQDGDDDLHAHFEYQVVAVYSSSTSETDTKTVYHLSVPYSARNVNGMATGADTVEITWTGSLEHADGDCGEIAHDVIQYVVQHRMNGEGKWLDIANNSVFSGFHTMDTVFGSMIDDLGAGVHEFRVIAIDRANQFSRPSDVVSITLAGRMAGLPRNFLADMDETHVELTWDHPIEGRPDDYNFRWAPKGYGDQPFQADLTMAGNYNEGHYYSDSNGHSESIYSSGTAADRQLIMSIRPGYRYVFQMKSSSGELTSRWVEAQVLYPSISGTVPATPTNLMAEYSNGKVVISWDETNDMSVTHYTLRRTVLGTHDAEYIIINNRRESIGGHVDIPTERGVQYDYYIKAHNNKGNGHESHGALVYFPELNDHRSGATDLGDITEVYSAMFPVEDLDYINDPRDYFRFELTETRTVDFGARRLDRNADLHLEDSNGTVLGSSVTSANSNESISRELNAGVYYLQVEAIEHGKNDYVLRYGVEEPS